jgi:hypothetical protein
MTRGARGRLAPRVWLDRTLAKIALQEGGTP